MRLIRLLKRDLAAEILDWVKTGIISREQADKISQRYDINLDQVHRHSIGYRVLVGLGILFIGLAIILLISENWDEIPRALRMWSLILLTVGVHSWGLLKYKNSECNTATQLFFLGNLLYGSSIILIAQIYHIGEHMPDGVFWWALGSLPIALLVNSTWLTLFSLLLAALWFLMEIDFGFYPLLFPLFLAGSYFVLYRGKQNLILFLVLIGCSGLWLEYTLAHFWRENHHLELMVEHVVVSVAFFILIYALGHNLNSKTDIKLRDYGALLSVWSLRFCLLFMLIMSYEYPWKKLIMADWNNLISMAIVSGLLISIALRLVKTRIQLVSLIAFTALLILTSSTVIISNDKTHANYLQVIINISLIIISIRLIFKGISSGISHYFFTGIAAILLTALIRYIDLIGDYIGGAILFIFFAVLLLGSAYYWKNYAMNRSGI